MPGEPTYNTKLLDTFRPPGVTRWETVKAFFSNVRAYSCFGLDTDSLPANDTQRSKIFGFETALRDVVDLVGRGWLPLVSPESLEDVECAAVTLLSAHARHQSGASRGSSDLSGRRDIDYGDAPARGSARQLLLLSEADKKKAIGADVAIRLRKLPATMLEGQTGVHHMPKEAQLDMQRIIFADSNVYGPGLSLEATCVPNAALVFKDAMGLRIKGELRAYAGVGELQLQSLTADHISSHVFSLQGKPLSLMVFIKIAKAVFAERHHDSTGDALLRDGLALFKTVHEGLLKTLNLDTSGINALCHRLMMKASAHTLPMNARFTYAERVLEQYDLAVVAFLRNARAPPPSLKDAMAATEAHYINLRVQVVSERAGTEAALKALGAKKGGAPQQGGGGQYGGGAAQQHGGAQLGGGQYGAGAQQGGRGGRPQSGAGGRQASGGHQGGGGGGGQQSGGGGNGSALLQFMTRPSDAAFTTFIGAVKLLKDRNGVVLCRNALYQPGGCTRASCSGWHPKRGPREAKTVLDAVKAAVPLCPFIAL